MRPARSADGVAIRRGLEPSALAAAVIIASRSRTTASIAALLRDAGVAPRRTSGELAQLLRDVLAVPMQHTRAKRVTLGDQLVGATN